MFIYINFLIITRSDCTYCKLLLLLNAFSNQILKYRYTSSVEIHKIITTIWIDLFDTEAMIIQVHMAVMHLMVTLYHT